MTLSRGLGPRTRARARAAGSWPTAGAAARVAGTRETLSGSAGPAPPGGHVPCWLCTDIEAA